MKPNARDQFMALVRGAVETGTLVKLTLGKSASADATLQNLFVRPVSLRAGPRLAFVWRHATKDLTKNHDAEQALGILDRLIGSEFLDAHLFTSSQTAQLETGGATSRLRVRASGRGKPPDLGHDRRKSHPIAVDAPWLRTLGVTDANGRPASAMADKLRQIEKFAELLGNLLGEAPLKAEGVLRVFDMGCGKGYLTFAVSELLGERAHVCGIEARADLVDFCTRAAAEAGMGDRLSFRRGSIAEMDVGAVDILIALHACDTATDDALAKGISAGAALIVVAPCCQKELRPQLVAPAVLSGALRHGIFAERQAEFVTDALRAMLLEWAGYRTRVIEFVSTEHTAKNTMITAVRTKRPGNESLAAEIRNLARFYGLRRQSLADHLGFALG